MHSNAASNSPVVRDIVLVGGGHSHAIVLREFLLRPMAGVRLTLISVHEYAFYSGMLPGLVAGHYRLDETRIDLDKLCALAGARFYKARVTGIDRAAKQVLCQCADGSARPAVPYDLLSINVGGAPDTASVPGAAEFTLPVKPIETFLERWNQWLDHESGRRGPGYTHPLRVAVVGGGAGGVELLLAMRQRLQRLGQAIELSLFTDGPHLLPTHNADVQRHAAQALREHGVAVHTHSPVVRAGPNRLQVGEQWLAFDEIIWVTRSRGAAWLKETGLALSPDGFIQVNDALQALTPSGEADASIFAAGDAAHMVNYALEKAGVFAVRQGRPLAENLRKALLHKPLRRYRPQPHWLALISLGKRRAIASRGGFWGTVLGRAANALAQQALWDWKDAIDRRFMQMFDSLGQMKPARFRAGGLLASWGGAASAVLHRAESEQVDAAQAMRCGGCGAKVPAGVLTRALAGLVPLAHPDVVIGLNAPDDAALVRVPAGQALVQSVDFFRSFMDDPYLLGRIAAQHALGDLFAMGATPQSASAIATVPPGLDRKVEVLLRDLMQGAVEVLNAAGCALVGGHTGEGAELALGFAVNGLIDEAALPAVGYGSAASGVATATAAQSAGRLMTKRGLQAGEVLILTKALGTGALLAARPMGLTQGRWIHEALAAMQQSNQAASRCLLAHGVRACTDVTGFGLLGHLQEMMQSSSVDVQLDLSRLPLLDGVIPCLEAGASSSLHSANARFAQVIKNIEWARQHPHYQVLFDPQTAGGLLTSVAPERAQACLAELRALGYVHAAWIGRITPMSTAAAALECVSVWDQ